MSVRINKYLAERGVCSRRQADVLIEDGKVFVNGKIAVKGMSISGDEDVQVNGKPLAEKRSELCYLAFNKPVGIMTSMDPNGHETIATFLDLKERLFPIGRLDVASSGLLILTNDGELSATIMHPSHDHEKEYIVTLEQEIQNEDLEKMASGMMILGSKTKPAKILRVGKNRFHITLTEGRNRQIRRMCEQLGHEVRALKRIRIMNIELGNLLTGTTRLLTQKEISILKSLSM